MYSGFICPVLMLLCISCNSWLKLVHLASVPAAPGPTPHHRPHHRSEILPVLLHLPVFLHLLQNRKASSAFLYKVVLIVRLALAYEINVLFPLQSNLKLSKGTAHILIQPWSSPADPSFLIPVPFFLTASYHRLITITPSTPLPLNLCSQYLLSEMMCLILSLTVWLKCPLFNEASH